MKYIFSDLTVDGNSLLLHSQKSVTQSNSLIAYRDHVREGCSRYKKID